MWPGKLILSTTMAAEKWVIWTKDESDCAFVSRVTISLMSETLTVLRVASLYGPGISIVRSALEYCKF